MFVELTSKRRCIPALSVGLSPSRFISWNAVRLYLGRFGKAQIPCRLDALDGLNDHVASSIVRRVAILACVGGRGGGILICRAPNSVAI